MRSVRAGCWGLAIFAVGLAVRLVWWPRIFTAGGFMSPHAADSYYHLRRIWYSVVDFPGWIERDPYVGFPGVGEIVWPPGFDLGIAALARLLVGQHQVGVETVAAWVPAVLGALTAVAAAALAARLFSPAAGCVAGLLLALLPAHYTYSQLGKVDHHCAVSLAGALLVLGCVSAVRRERPWPGLAVALGLGAAAFLYLWAGGLLLLALLQALAVFWMLQARDGQTAILRARHLALVQGLAALALAPYALGRTWEQYGGWSPLVLCSFQPVWFAAAAAACAVLAVAWRWPRLGDTPLRRWLSAAALGAVALAVAFAALPELAGSLDYAAGWFSKAEDFQLQVIELRPLFASGTGSQVEFAEERFTRLVYAFPVALLWLVASAWRDGRADRWLVAAWGTVFGLGVLTQIRFMNSFSVPYAVVMGGVVVAGVDALRRRLGGWPLAGAAAGLAILVAWAAAPAAGFLAGRAAVWWGGEGMRTPVAYVRGLAYRNAARWLGRSSPPTRGYLDLTLEPEYGVLVPWDVGHLVRYEAERPQLQDNLGVYVGRESFLAAGRYYAAVNEEQAWRLLHDLGARYVMIDPMGSGHSGTVARDSMSRRLYPPGIRGAEPARLPGLGHHRLVYETPPATPGIWHVLVYELVPGARIEGRAPPGARVEAELGLQSPARGRPLSWRAAARAGPNGRFRILTPYPNGADGPGLRAGAYTVLRCPGASARVVVPEQAVRRGARVPAPDLDCREGVDDN